RSGIYSVRQLCQLSERQLVDIWHGVLGAYWWHWLREDDDADPPPARRRTFAHSHVLPPGLRTHHGARAGLAKLIGKAAARMRRHGCAARRMEVYISFSYREEGWSAQVKLGQSCQDTTTMVEAFGRLWHGRPATTASPTQVAITLYDLV